MEKLTEWYPADIKPVRVGMYQRDYGYGVGVGYAYWNGRYFYSGSMSFGCAAELALLRRIRGIPNLPWRGLAQDPEAAHD